MKISDFSRLSNTSTRMLRHYEKIGLLSVERSDQNNNYRDYSPKQLKTVAQIKTLQELGFSLSNIKEILNSSSPSELTISFNQQKEQLQQALEKIQIQQNLLDSISDVLTDNQDYLNYHVTLKDIPERHVMSLRRVVPNYEAEQYLWQELYQEYLLQEVQFSEPSLGISIYHNESYEEQDIDIEIQSSIVGDYVSTDNVQFKLAPNMMVASTTFQGSFEQMPLVMEALAIWIEANHYEIDGPMINIFHVTAAQEKNPNNWITEACIVIKEKEML